ncbi:M24 family metallopeptidase [Siminovitchia acidinfaciens]|uniref:M24 family metallopeptidase n=1 Tax=Siminovitchia acidinfaciens TaxID=2321395 RepID=A0A429XWB8_9BACI|nr:M24 family metallopeptidase [Siminovitchia acidinfaciens]
MLLSIFTLSEYKSRLQKTKEKMGDEGIDVLLVTDPANINYLSGYNAWSYYTHQLLIVIIDESEPIWVGRGIDESAARYTTWLKNHNIISYSDDYVQSTIKHPMDFVTDLLMEKNQSNRTIAMEYDAYFFTGQNYIILTNNLPNATFKNATNLINWIRIIKSEQEIEYIRRAANIISHTMNAAIEKINAGVRKCDVVADIYQSQISGTEQYGGDYPAFPPLLPSGNKTSACHLTWTDEKFNEGDPVILELAGCHNRYHSPLARTLVIGKPTKEMETLAEVVIEGINEALAAVKPGVTCEEVEMVWRESIKKRGFEKESRIGYSIGLNYPPDWGEHTASLRPGDKTIIQPNMTFHMIPGIWLDDYGIEISESFVVTETGIEILANVERKLFVKESLVY